MSRRVIPAGDSLKDFHWAGGEADRIGAAYSSDPDVPGGLIDIPLCRESRSRELHCSGGDLPSVLTPHNHIKN